jgi:glycosyltransferase involved in cell wall biosynthesis
MKVPYKICHLAKYYPPVPGGIETHVQTIARAQSDLGAEVSVICVNGLNEKKSQSIRTKTINELDKNVQVKSLGRVSSFARFDICPDLLRKINEFANCPNTIFHLHTPNPTMLAALVAIRKRTPLVITHHSDIIKQRVLKYAFRPIEHFVYSQASCILTTSSEYISGSKFLRLYQNNLSYLPLGLDCSNYLNPSKEALAYSRQLKGKYDSPIWLSVGRLVYYKALHVAIEALTFVPGKLIVIGTGSLEKELKEQAKKLGVEDRIVWLGRVSADQLVGAYHAATALWFPSNARSEGFGLVQVEAMASGCPVINANIPGSGVSWVSRHEKEGLTVPLDNPFALALAAKRLLDEPSLRNRLANASRDRACQEFDDRTMAKRSFEVYENALNCQSEATSFRTNTVY